MTWQIDASGLTDIGMKRDSNQDQFLIAELSKSMHVEQTSIAIADASTMFGGTQGKLLLVADGMGGHAAGEKASAVAVSSIATYVLNSLQWYFRLDGGSDDDFADDLREGIKYSNEKIMSMGRQSPDDRGMGTTLTLAYVIWPRLYVVHVGDSRCYLVRDGDIRCMTRDHTLAEVYAEANGGHAAELSKFSNVLWNVLGGENNDDITVEIHKATLHAGDTLLLCSDGLYKYLSDDDLLAVLNASDTAEAACHQLVAQANRAGGSDNITVVVSRFDKAPTEEDGAVVETQVPLESLIDKQQKPNCDLKDTDDFISLGSNQKE